jgi:peptide deformylase
VPLQIAGSRKVSVRLKIVQVGEPVLRQRARALTPQEILGGEIQQLIAHLRETMHDAPGVGLAAPQVGLSLQIAVIEDSEESLRDIAPAQLVERERRPVPFHVIINPVIRHADVANLEFFEGCLSLAGFSAIVPRARRVTVECLDEHARPRVIQASGWYARILQHEIGHLHGELYIDHMRSRTFTSLDNFGRFFKSKPIRETLSELDAEKKQFEQRPPPLD